MNDATQTTSIPSQLIREEFGDLITDIDGRVDAQDLVDTFSDRLRKLNTVVTPACAKRAAKIARELAHVANRRR